MPRRLPPEPGCTEERRFWNKAHTQCVKARPRAGSSRRDNAASAMLAAKRDQCKQQGLMYDRDEEKCVEGAARPARRVPDAGCTPDRPFRSVANPDRCLKRRPRKASRRDKVVAAMLAAKRDECKQQGKKFDRGSGACVDRAQRPGRRVPDDGCTPNRPFRSIANPERCLKTKPRPKLGAGGKYEAMVFPTAAIGRGQPLYATKSGAPSVVLRDAVQWMWRKNGRPFRDQREKKYALEAARDELNRGTGVYYEGDYAVLVKKVSDPLPQHEVNNLGQAFQDFDEESYDEDEDEDWVPGDSDGSDE